FDEVEQGALAAAVFLHDAVADVGTIEGADELAGVFQRQALGDLAPGRGVGGRGQGDPRDVGPAFVQDRELAVFGTEVVAPLGDAVGFVDREQGDVGAIEQVEAAAAQQALGGNVEQVQPAFEQV